LPVETGKYGHALMIWPNVTSEQAVAGPERSVTRYNVAGKECGLVGPLVIASAFCESTSLAL